VDTHQFEAVNPERIAVEAGDIVDIYLPPGKTVLAGFLVLIVPLLLFAAGYLITGSVLPEASEGIKAVFGIIGLVVGFLLSFSYGKKRKADSMPVITAVKGKGPFPIGNPMLKDKL
jgi:sigma-E factor negative regulatory protein RseC